MANQPKKEEKQKEIFKMVDEYIISISEPLGGGAYGKVYRGYFNNKGPCRDKTITLAIKETPLPRGFSAEEHNQKKVIAMKEINIMKKLNHPNVIKFIDAKKTDNNIYLIMEFCNGGSLEDLVKQKKGTMDEMEALYYFRDIVDAFRYLRAHNMVHRDVKPENVLINDGVLKLADFGFAREVSGDDNARTIAGTPLFQDPNIALGGEEGYSIKSDIFSLGVLLYYMLYFDPKDQPRSYPWYAPTAAKLVQEMLKKPLIFPETKKVSKQVKELITRMLKINDKERIGWDELFSQELCKTKLDPIYHQGLMEKSRRDEGMRLARQGSISSDIINIDAKEVKLDDQTHSEQLKIAREITEQIKTQNQQIQKGRRCLERIDHERNVAMLIFSTALKFIEVVKPRASIPKDVSMKLMYVLTKRCLLFFQRMKDMVIKKQNELNFPLDEWNAFVSIPEQFERASNKIRSDYDICHQNFKKFLAEARQFEDEYSRFIDDSMQINEEFNDAVVSYVLRLMVPLLVSVREKFEKKQPLTQVDENLLYVADNLIMIFTLETSLSYHPSKKRDFNKFYDERKLIPKQYLFGRIVLAYQHLNLL